MVLVTDCLSDALLATTVCLKAERMDLAWKAAPRSRKARVSKCCHTTTGKRPCLW